MELGINTGSDGSADTRTKAVKKDLLRELKYETLSKIVRPKGAPRKVFKTAENGLIAYLEEQPWAMQKEMVWYIWEEWGIGTSSIKGIG